MRQHSLLFYEGDQLLCDKIGRYVCQSEAHRISGASAGAG